MRTPRQAAGYAAESCVVERLTGTGWTILARNLRVGRDELDIVAIDHAPPGALVVVEVRLRTSRAYGLPEETLDWRKRSRLRRAAMALLDRGIPDGPPLPRLSLRIDLVVVEPPEAPGGPPRIRHHRAAVGGG